MAGDGVNDAAALAAAEVGNAMGTGTEVAMESAGVTLLKADLTRIVRARRLSRATMNNIRLNLFFAFAYNAAGIPIAAGVLYPRSVFSYRRRNRGRRCLRQHDLLRWPLPRGPCGVHSSCGMGIEGGRFSLTGFLKPESIFRSMHRAEMT
ncbi:hypothetical protein WN73_37775 [Bradyrhizobium sp. CCBAU 45394]|nr:hypothetical protein [Bradyrhizobium sp. CCBAU 45394]